MAVHCVKTVLTLNKPIYSGYSIVELSKLLMYKFHFDYVSNNVDANLLFTDTDSFVYVSDSGYKKCFKDKHFFDFSGYKKSYDYYDILNKKC